MAWVTRQQKTNNKFICLGDGETCKLFWKKRFSSHKKKLNRFQTFLKAEASSIQWRPCSPSGHSIFSKAFVGTKFGGKVVGFFIFDAGVWKCCRNTSWLQGWNIWCGYHPGYFKGGHHWEQGSLCRAIRQGLGAKLPFPFTKSWAECQKSKTPKEKKHLKLNPKRRPETGGLYEEKWLPLGRWRTYGSNTGMQIKVQATHHSPLFGGYLDLISTSGSCSSQAVFCASFAKIISKQVAVLSNIWCF